MTKDGSIRGLVLATLAVAAMGWGAARAESGEEGEEGGGGFAQMDPTMKTECSACHTAYPAEFLPKESWTLILDNLPKHFGEDASLPAETIAPIRDYLMAHAAPSPATIDPANPPLRITGLDWFVGEHGQRLMKQAKADPAIGSMSNCGACHKALN